MRQSFTDNTLEKYDKIKHVCIHRNITLNKLNMKYQYDEARNIFRPEFSVDKHDLLSSAKWGITDLNDTKVQVEGCMKC